jgi:predicted glycoside hydrolase/deacetylase ChbG (UPF0249 family)
MKPPNLLINADDFGIHPRVSLAIGRCLDEGLIDSFSALPFTDAFHSDLLRDIVARHPGAKIGAHLSLPGKVSGGKGDDPLHYRRVLADYFLGRIDPARVRADWEAHIRSLGSYLGGPERLAHLDGHQHVHILPGLWRAARSLQKQFAIPRLRVPYESLRRSLFHKFPFGAALQALALARRRSSDPRLLGFFTSTHFTVAGNMAGLREAVRRPEKAFELMVHPALPGVHPALPGVHPALPGVHPALPGVHPALPGPAGEAGLQPDQEREMDELRRLRDFFRTETRVSGAAPA